MVELNRFVHVGMVWPKLRFCNLQPFHGLLMPCDGGGTGTQTASRARVF